jgi:hypothetical protein
MQQQYSPSGFPFRKVKHNCAKLFGIYEAESVGMDKRALRVFELARVLVCVDHVASFIVNANHNIM